MRVFFLFVVSFSAFAQAQLGRFRLLDFTARTAATVAGVSSGTNLTITPGSFSPVTGDCVWIYQPKSIVQDILVQAGNTGRGYFCLTVTDSTHWILSTEMYTEAATSGQGVSVGDKIVPLTTYYLREGPRLFLDGPAAQGAWSVGTQYKMLDSVTNSGNTYEAIAEPPVGTVTSNTTYWKQINPANVGPGTFTASMRNTSGKASPTHFPFTKNKSNIDTYFPATQIRYDFTVTEGVGYAFQAAWQWLADNNVNYYNMIKALTLQAEDLANGTPTCVVDSPVGYCGRATTLDYARLNLLQATLGMAVVYETLSTAEKQTLANRLLNDNDVAHNGIDTTPCTNMPMIQGAFSSADMLTGQSWTFTGTGFLSKAGLGPGSVILAYPVAGYKLEAIARIKQVIDDSHMSVEHAKYSRLNNAQGATKLGYNTGTTEGSFAGVNQPWYYTPAWDDSAHYCGVKWWLTHHPSTPALIPGLEQNFKADWSYLPNAQLDYTRINNRTITATGTWLAMGLLLADVDIRAVRLVEQTANYHAAVWMAQNLKSRWAAYGGHGTQYGPGRVYSRAADIALMMQNSLTTTPPGYVTGGYLKNILRAFNYSWWNSRPQFQQPFENGYAMGYNSDFAGGQELYNFGPAVLAIMNLYPNDPHTAIMYDYLRNRRGDYGLSIGSGNWWAYAFLIYGFPLYDPLHTLTPITGEPLQQGLFDSDLQECIDAGLYCIADANMGVAFSTTGWTNTDTQLSLQAQGAIPVFGEDNYGTAGCLSILQNNGIYGAMLLGGNGNNLTTGMSPNGALYDCSMPMIWNSSTFDKVSYTTGKYAYAKVDRWAGAVPGGVADNSYMYARVDLSATYREASTAYAVPVQGSVYTVSGDVKREVIHFKSGPSNPNYVVVLDTFRNVAAGNQLRSYWHFQTTRDASTSFGIGRHPEWITTDFGNKAARMVPPNTGRLNIKSFAVPGAANGVAMSAENYTPAAFTAMAMQDTTLLSTNPPTWSGGVATIHPYSYAYGAYALPTDGSVSITVANVVSSGPGSFNGTFPVTGYSYIGGVVTITYALATNPGTYTSGGNISYPAWCTYTSPANTVASCAGNYRRPTSNVPPTSAWPSTYRVHSCVSSDDTNCGNFTDGEILTVLQPSTSSSATLPSTNLPSCSSAGGDCVTLELLDASYPKVAIMARNGALLSSVAVTTTHSGVAPYVVTGLQAGTYDIAVGGSTIATGVATSTDTSLTFVANSGDVTITRTGGAVSGLLTRSPGSLSFTCTSGDVASANQDITISASGVTLDNWSVSESLSWLTLSPISGSVAGTTTASIACAGLSAGVTSGLITLTSTTVGVSNSPQTISVSVTKYAAPSISTSSPLPGGQVSIPYSTTLTATQGLAPYTWDVSAGTLCTGLILSSAGVVSGTPTTAQTCNFTARITDSQSTPVVATKAFAITITAGAAAVTLVASPSSVAFSYYGGDSYPAAGLSQTITFTTTGGSIGQWLVSTDVAWLSAAPNSGTTAADFTITANLNGLSAGIYSGQATLTSSTVGVTNTPLVIPVTLTITPPSIITTSVPSGAVYRPYTTTLLLAAGTAPDRIWTVTSGALPAGVVLDASTGTISGTPLRKGSFTFGVNVAIVNIIPSVEQVLVMTIADATPAVDEGGKLKRQGRGR